MWYAVVRRRFGYREITGGGRFSIFFWSGEILFTGCGEER